MADVILPPLPEENEDPWYEKRDAFDRAIKQQLEGPLSESGLKATIVESVPAAGSRAFARNVGVYLPTQMAGRKWRRKRAAVLAGLERGHIAIMGDSIPFGAASTGTTPPKNVTSYPGRLRAMLEQRGLYGGGLNICNHALLTNPTWDPRWSIHGSVSAAAYGFHKQGAYQIVSGSADNYIEFTEYCDEFVVYLANNAGAGRVTIDGGEVQLIQAGPSFPTGGIPPETGYATRQRVTRVPAGDLGEHTIRIFPNPTTASQDLYLLAVKHVISGNGKFEVSNPSISGRSLNTLFSLSNYNDETNGYFGLPMIDMLKADLLVCALGINDWQTNRQLSAAQADLGTLFARQTTSGNAPTGAPKANGDFALLWNPQPNTTALGTSSPQTWAQWREGWYDAADSTGAPLIDLGDRWIDFATGQSAGYFADTIHPNDAGSLDMVAAVEEAIMHRI